MVLKLKWAPDPPHAVVGNETRTTTEDETTGMHIHCDSVVSDASLHIDTIHHIMCSYIAEISQSMHNII